MNKQQLEAFAREAAKSIKTERDLSDFTRKAMYTTDAIDSLNSVVRKATSKRKVFPTDDSARKVVCLAV